MNEFIDALKSARDKVSDLNVKIAALEARRSAIVQTPPHTDDIVGAYNRGLALAAQQFEQRLGIYLNDANAAKPYAADMVAKSAGEQLLTLPQLTPGPDHVNLFFDATIGLGGLPLDMAAVTYFLQDAIASEIPLLVRRLCPKADQGMKQADREAALAAVDAELGEVRGQRDELLSSLEAARAAATPHHGVSGAEREQDKLSQQFAALLAERAQLQAEFADARMTAPNSPATGLLGREVERIGEELSRLADLRDRQRQP